MTNDRELLQQALDALEGLLGWQSLAPAEELDNAKAAAFCIRARLSQCERCGEVNPAEIHTCTPKQEEGCAGCGKQSSEGWALYCVKCSETVQEPIGWIYEDDEGRILFSQMPHPDPLWEPVYRAQK